MAGNQEITLDRYLSSKGPLPAAQVARIAYQVSLQMDRESDAAPQGRAAVVHPGRIAIDAGGAVKLLPPAGEDLELPVAVAFPAYVSPEEIAGQAGDVRSSLYSLGCTIYELLAGNPPFGGAADPAKETLQGHRRRPVPDPRQASPGIDDAFAETIRELLAKDPQLRIQSVSELLRRLMQTAGLQGAPGRKPRPAPARPAAPPAAPKAAAPKAAAPKAAAPAAPRPAAVKAPPAATPPRAPLAKGPAAPPRQVQRPAAVPAQAPPARAARPAAPGRPAASRGAEPNGRRSRAARLEGASAAGRRRAAGRGLPREEMDLEEVAGAEPGGRHYYCTYVGLALGVLIGAIFALNLLDKAKLVPELEEQNLQQAIAQAQLSRHNAFLKRLETDANDLRLAVRQAKMQAADSRLLRSDRRGYLEASIDRECARPGIAELLAELDQLGPPEADVRGDDLPPEGEEGYRRIVEEYNRLLAENKLGAACDKIREAEAEYKKLYGVEIDALFSKAENRMMELWEADEKAVQSLAQKGEKGQALALLDKAMVYGDPQIKKKVSEYRDEIQRQAILQGGGKEKEEVDFSELEAELKGLGAGKQAGAADEE
jgi:hypothetical protein